VGKAFQFYPEAASSYAGQIDNLYFFLVALTVVMTLGIGAVALFFFVKYRRRSESECPEEIEGSLVLEITWSVIPLIICLGIFFWGTNIYMGMVKAPADSVPVYVVGKQWMWKLQHPDGRREINELHVPIGQNTRIIMASEDVLHSFYVPAFRTKMDVVPGKYTSLWFRPTKVGTYRLFCAEYCGTSHASMNGWVHVLSEADYAAWLSGNVANESMEEAGERLFTENKCNTCHAATGSTQLGPSLSGIYGESVTLQNGRTVTVDDAYIRESILQPLAKIVTGFNPVMPTYETQLSEQQIMQIISYIKTLKPADGEEGGHE
jgi:cytochrome c oxidase subunit II